MSEIRGYRGKRIDTKEWVYGSLIKRWLSGFENIGVTKLSILQLSCGDDGNQFETNEFDVDPSTVGQYTGRFAADNSTKLFEGDIVAHSYIGSEAIIRFGEYCDDADGQEKTHIGYYLEYLDKDCTYYKGLNKWASYPSIVYRLGNIYDNPELLEVEE